MKSLSIYKTELRASIVWHIAWLVSLTAFLLLLVVIYPGDKAMNDLTPLFQTSYFQDLLGNFGSASPGYALWISLLLPFMTIILLIYAMTTGVRTAVQSVSDGTGELLHTLPVSRSQFLITRLLSNLTPILVYFIIQGIVFSTPVAGHTIKFDVLVTLGWWGFLFCLFGVLFGILFGLFVGNSSKGHQVSIIVILVFYALQIMARLNTNVTSLNDINPLSYYQPDQYLLGLGFVKEGKIFGISYHYYPVVLLLLSILFLLIGLFEFNRKDLSDDAGFHLNFIRRITIREQNKLSTGDIKIIHFILLPFIFVKNIFFPKNVRNNPFVFWARIFEKRLPATADFIYSDNMLLFIAFLAVFLFFPFQIGYYPGDQVVSESINGFASSGIFLVFTYGHNLATHPYLWYMVANTIGIIWMVLLPLCFFWVRKAITLDGNSGTGEILGGIPLDSRSIVLQRMFAIFCELFLLLLLMVFWVVFCEALTHATYNKVWEILSILGMFPLYVFLITFSAILALFFRQKGNLLSGLFLTGVILSFSISILNTNLNDWFFRGIFSAW